MERGLVGEVISRIERKGLTLAAVELRTADTAWLRRLIWRLGGRGVVVDPPEVVTEVAAGAAAALTAYGEA